MSLDIASLLLRVVDEGFDERVAVVNEGFSSSSPHIYIVRLRANGREARLVASPEWSEVQLDLGVHYTELHEDADEADVATALRCLALVSRAYLNGEGEVRHRRSVLPWRPKVPSYAVTVNGTRYRLGRYSFSSS